MSTKKNDPNTIFLRYSPPSSALTRFHLETVCSDIGPVKKCSLIRKKQTFRGEKRGTLDKVAAGFAFVKFTTKEDAKEAVEQLNQKNIFLDQYNGSLANEAGEGITTIKLMVDLASDEAATKEKDYHRKEEQHQGKETKETDDDDDDDDDEQGDTMENSKTNFQEDEILQKRKRTSRLILRNLSFYATSNDVKKVMEKEFGKIVEINLPLVPGKKSHRGFAFVTFENVLHAKKAVEKGTLTIKKRQVAIDYSVSKFQHQRLQKEEQVENTEDNESNEANDKNDDSSEGEDASENDSESDSDSSDEEEDVDSDDDNEEEEKVSKKEKPVSVKTDVGVSQHRTLFLRNLPYDCTRHDLFQLFARFGTISSIYLVKDRNTGILKGTAFLEYQHPNFAEAALSASGCGSVNTENNPTSSKDLLFQTPSTEDGIHLNGRRIFANYAVDKQTAASLTVDSEQKKIGKDKRNLYLKNEGRVGTEEGWEEELLDSDREKRGRAHNEKSQKLRSPLFFINSLRLSIRNLAKHIEDESQLRTLIVEGLEEGLKRNLVSKEDMWLHERAKGENIPRSKMLDMEVAEFDNKQIKQSIPSIYIDKDPITSASKGFAFVEFTHHEHALACLRQLNNNPRYSKEYTAGGKKAAQGNGKVPRLIVEFTVENKAKAKLQADRRARQLQNVANQKAAKNNKNNSGNENGENAHVETQTESSKRKKMSRGALQREKKRKLKTEKEQGSGSTSETKKSADAKKANTSISDKSKTKLSKPPKRQKVDKEEEAFESMVQSYKSKFMDSVKSKVSNKEGKTNTEREDIKKRRWFE